MELTGTRGGDVHIAGDGNFHHQHAADAGHDTENKVQEPKYFIPKEFVDAHGAHIEASRGKPVQNYQQKVPDEVVDDCEDNLEAADEKKLKTNGIKFNDTGLAALVCCHDIPLFFANIDTPGEQQKYMVALLDYLYSLLPPQTAVLCLYDVGCVLKRSLQLVSPPYQFLWHILDKSSSSMTSFPSISHHDYNLLHLPCMHMDINGVVSLSTILA